MRDMNRKAIGSPIQDLDTPALLLDSEVSQGNLRKMSAFFRDRSCKLRPHFKNHKCATLARHQLEAGSAVGVTCAKVGEAEVLAEHGIENILIANQVVGRAKVQRLIDVAHRSNVAVAVDDISQALAISEAAQADEVAVGLLVETDCGMGRCGVPPGKPTLQLVQQIADLPSIRFDGIQAFEGHLVYVNDYEERQRKLHESMEPVIQTRHLIEENGIHVPTVSGGASSTYKITGAIEGFGEIQAGTYATMDWRYHELTPEFHIALSILVTVISRPKPGTAVLDMGVKGAGGEFGPPRIKGYPQVETPGFASEEHMIVQNTPSWRVGDKLEAISSHACTTCNLYRELYVHEDEKVVDVWPIEASGRLA